MARSDQGQGEPPGAKEQITVQDFGRDRNIKPDRVAVELNVEIVKREAFDTRLLKKVIRVEISELHRRRKGIAWGRDRPWKSMRIIGSVLQAMNSNPAYGSGTGKYKDFIETQKAIEASGADVVTVAVRRVNITDRSKENLLDYIDPKKYRILPNTAGCYTVEDAVRYARLARAAGISDLVKLEVLGDEKTLFPDTIGLLEAAKILVKEGFVVLPYTNDDPIIAKKLVDIGCPAVMPLAAPIGSGLGIRNPYNLKILMEAVNVPVIVDAGVGTASDAALAMEYGADAVSMIRNS